MFPNAEESNKISVHKILAILIQVYSENPFFDIDSSRCSSSQNFLINERFNVDVMSIILTEWKTKEFKHPYYFDIEKFKSTYFSDFIMLLTDYKIMTTTKGNKLFMNSVFFFSDIISFIEQEYLIKL